MADAVEIELDFVSGLGAEESVSVQTLTLYIPDRDREGKEIGNQRQWVLEGAALLCEIGGGVTIQPAVEGGWLDRDAARVIWEKPVLVYTYVDGERLPGALPRLRAFLHRMGRDTRQGEVAIAFDDEFYRIRKFDP